MQEFDVEKGFITRLLTEQDIEIVRDNKITERFFTGDNRNAFRYILDTAAKTGELPTIRAFEKAMPRYKLERDSAGDIGTDENMLYWIDELREKVKHNTLADGIEKAAELLNAGKVDETGLSLRKTISFVDLEVEKSSGVKLNDNLEGRKKEYERRVLNKGVTGIPTGIPFLDFMFKGLSEDTLTTMIASTGVGKAMPLDTPILTPKGFVPLSEIHIGDIVYDEQGKPTKVIGEYPQGMKQVYKISFSDGTFVECCSEHLWKFKTIDNVNRNQDWQVHTLSHILGLKVRGSKGEYRLSVPVNAPIEFGEKDLFIDPYLMGALLGDGGFSQPQITFTNPEDDVVSKVKELIAPFGDFVEHGGQNKIQYYFKGGRNNVFVDYIRSTFGHCLSSEKFIPAEYLIASVEHRIRLLQGLIDTDGSVDEKGHISFSTKSKKLAEDFSFLVRSLGYRVSLKSYCRKDKDYGVDYVATIFALTDKLFTSKKHKDRFDRRRKANKEHHYELHRISSIEELPVKKEMKCIAVDSPLHTFICKDFVVTHNTYIQVLIGAYAILNGYKVLQCVTEMSSRQIRDRYEAILYAMTTGAFNMNEFKAGSFSPQMKESYFNFLDEVMSEIDLPIETAESPLQVEALVQKYGADLLLIDGVYLMNDDKGADSDWLRIANITRSLKQMVKRLHIAGFINTQADGKTSRKTGPELGDIMYAQAIGQDSDNVFTAYRTPLMYEDREICLKILKGREGGVGKCMLSWDFTNMQFREIYSEKEKGKFDTPPDETESSEGTFINVKKGE